MKSAFKKVALLLSMSLMIIGCSTRSSMDVQTSTTYAGTNSTEKMTQYKACQAEAAEIMADKNYDRSKQIGHHDIDDDQPRQSPMDQFISQDMEMTMDRLDQERIVDECLRKKGWDVS